MIDKVLVIANPGSGKGEAPEHAKRLGELLVDTYQCVVDIRETTKFEDTKTWAKAAKDEGYDTVICLGGDGTVSETINGLMAVENPPQFSFVPLGTANDLGRALGFEMDTDAAIDQFKHLTEDYIDIGQVNDRYFMDVVAVGDLSSAIMETDSDRKNTLGFLAYVLDGAQAIVEAQGDKYRVTNSAGDIFEFHSGLIIAALTSSVGGIDNLIPHGKYNNGLVQFAALKDGLITSAIQTLVNDGGIKEEFTDNENILSFMDTSLSLHRLEDVGQEVRLSNVDGDEGPALPLEIKVHPKALKVLRPQAEN